MIRIISSVALVAIFIALIGVYLSPNDLVRCNGTPTGAAPCQKADAIIAVSGGDTDARTQGAIDLYRKQWAYELIFSGAAADKTGPSNAIAMKRYALQQGVPNDAITTESFSENTHQNASNLKAIVEQNHFSRVILVTSAYHQRRASLELQRMLGPSVQVVNSPIAHDSQWSFWWWLTPIGWWLAVGELVKILLIYVGLTA